LLMRFVTAALREPMTVGSEPEMGLPNAGVWPVVRACRALPGRALTSRVPTHRDLIISENHNQVNVIRHYDECNEFNVREMCRCLLPTGNHDSPVFT
jgi:hypothetical protein